MLFQYYNLQTPRYRDICYKIYVFIYHIQYHTNTVARQDMLVVCEAIGVCMLEQIVQGPIQNLREICFSNMHSECKNKFMTLKFEKSSCVLLEFELGLCTVKYKYRIE